MQDLYEMRVQIDADLIVQKEILHAPSVKRSMRHSLKIDNPYFNRTIKLNEKTFRDKPEA